MIPDSFIELYYGKYQTVDLHGLTLEEAKAELIYFLGRVEFDTKCVLVVHGYHAGQVLKNFVRKQFKHELIEDRVNLDAGRTIFLLKK